MTYKQLNLSPLLHPEYCFARVKTDDGCSVLRFQDGRDATERYPDPEADFEVHLDPYVEGLKLPSLMGNTRRLLILHEEALRLFREFDTSHLQSFAFTLINHKKRVHSRDYRFVNPVGSLSFAHESSSFIRCEVTNDIWGCSRWVLQAEKLKGLPDIIRPVEYPSACFISERLVTAIEAAGLTNFEFVDVGLV